MSSTSEQSAKGLFLAALEIENPEEREAFLRRECGEDDDLYQRVCHLIALDQSDDNLLGLSQFSTLDSERQQVMEALHTGNQFLEDLGKDIVYIGDYELIEEIGRGAMGVVFRGRQTSLNRPVAIKIIMGATLASSTERERFRIEAEAAANLSHPHIVPIYEIGQHEEHDYYSMRLITGGTLSDRIATLGQNKRASVRFMVKIIRAMQIAHENGILHRDLKPDNILLDDDGEPHISDFGLACHLEQDSHLTLPGQIMGTPQYMAPEQAEGGGKKITTAADIYSLGSIFYELLTGAPAFRGESVLTTLKMVKEKMPKPLSTQVDGIDRDLETIILKCLEKDPKARYPSARTLAEDCEAWLEHRPIAARPPTTFERLRKWVRRRPIHAALTGTAALFVLTLGIGGPITALRQAKLRNKAETAFLLAEERAEENRQQLYYSDMNLGGLSIAESGMFPTLTPLLDRWLPKNDEKDRRGWEWYYLSSFIQQTSFEVPEDGMEIASLDLSPSGQEFANASLPRKTIQIRDLQSGNLRRELNLPVGSRQVVWSPNGTSIFSSSRREMRLQDSQSGEIQARVEKPHKGRPSPIIGAWHPSGSRLATAAGDEMIRIWNGANLKPIREFPILFEREKAQKLNREGGLNDNTDFISKLRWSPDGKHLAILAIPRDDYRTVYVRSMEDPQRPILRLRGHEAAIRDFAWSPDSTHLVTGSSDKTARIYDLSNGKTITVLRGHTGWVSAVAWHPDGKKLVTASVNREVKIWDWENASELESLSGQTARTTAIACSQDGNTIVASDTRGGLKAWRTQTASRVSRTLFRHHKGIDFLCWSPDGSRLACTTADDDTFVIDIATGRATDRGHFVKQWSPSTAPLTWSPDGRFLAFLHDDASFVSLVNPETGKVVHRFHTKLSPDQTPVVSSAWSPDARELVTTSYGAQINHWNVENGDLLRMLSRERDPGSPLLSISWSPDGKHVVASGKYERINVWQAHNGEQLDYHHTPKSSSWYIGHAWHPDSSHLALGNFDSTITIWRPHPLTKVHLLTGHTSEVKSVSWHPQGNRLASGSGDQTIKIWDTQTGRSTMTLRGHTNDVKSLAWSPNGRMLASCSRDGTLRLWDASRAYHSFKESATP